MDFLITVIGNAAVDPIFRGRFLSDPVDTIDHYGIHLTKGEFELMLTVFANLTPDEKYQMEEAFSELERILYLKKQCTHPCLWSIYPPPELRATYPKAA